MDQDKFFSIVLKAVNDVINSAVIFSFAFCKMQLSRKLKIVNDHETNPGADGQIEPSCNLDPTTKPTGFVQLLRRIEKERKARVAQKISKILQQTLDFVTFCSCGLTRAHIFGLASIGHATRNTHSSKTCCSKSPALTARTRKCLQRAVGLENQTSDTSVGKVNEGKSVK